MPGIYYIHLALIAATIGLTISIPITIMISPNNQPSMLTIACTAFNWFMMLNYNPVWAGFWEEWKDKFKR